MVPVIIIIIIITIIIIIIIITIIIISIIIYFIFYYYYTHLVSKVRQLMKQCHNSQSLYFDFFTYFLFCFLAFSLLVGRILNLKYSTCFLFLQIV